MNERAGAHEDYVLTLSLLRDYHFDCCDIRRFLLCICSAVNHSQIDHIHIIISPYIIEPC